MPKMTVATFQKTILDWYKQNKRDLPWRRTKDPYKILVSEVMLQQTQVSRVLPKYEEFLTAFPTIEALAKAPDKKLLKVWAGLGYWKRAKYLKQIAKTIIKDASKIRPRNLDPLSLSPRQARASLGRAHTLKFLRRIFSAFPQDPKILETFPGIGPYTARAIACFAHNNKQAFLDTNIRRVYLHFFFGSKKNVADKEILKIAQEAVDALPKGVSAREWHYALFDYGATVLKNKSINKRSRRYAKQSKFEGSFRSFRAKAVRHLLAQPSQRIQQARLAAFVAKELKKQNAPYSAKEIIEALLKDNLIKQSKTHYHI